ncbi:YihY/virulence factor BrkB family protein [Sphingomonas lenta]|uniref:Ribonuclease BN n=1 Tax=Sphingomonas lenta TaxID=1141887 RepID=A0A2A2SDQ4_9SPHN|nr:YihY/virulence factor BrkB family protein [Sphingomonas lenta]PAX07414.1 ribonuclease BN [Sphingomonas lenta]
MSEPTGLTPEERAQAKKHGRTRQFLQRELGRMRPGERATAVAKRAALGVWNFGFIHAGNLAYLALTALFPFFIVAAAVLALFGQDEETLRTVETFLRTLPPDTAELLRKPLSDVIAARTGSLLWLGALVGLWTVGSFVETIRDIFRQAYGYVSTAPFWRTRLSSSLVIIASVVLALFSFLLQGFLTAAEQFVYRLFPFAEDVAGWIGLSRFVPALVMFGALWALFRSVTPRKYRRCPIWPGAAFTAAWWVSMTAGLPWALGQLGGYDLTYGSLAGVVVLLTFFYLIGLGVVFGAHLNAALAEPPEPALGNADAETGAEAAPA